MERPRRITGQDPTYTRQARQAHIEGEVVVRIEIARDGRVRDVTVLTGLPFLDEEVVRTVRRWRFSPPIVGGRRAAIYMIQRITFQTAR
jgi:protein TonB